MSGCTSNITAGFIDLATFDEQEKYMYGGKDAVAYFVRDTRKATWFTIIPVCLSRASGNPDFGTDWSSSISRAGDYLLQTWIRCDLPAITVLDATRPLNWTRNLMHHLVRECSITFNDLVAARFDSAHLDFWAAFTVPSGKQNGYNNMIGNVPMLYTPNAVSLPAYTLNLPLPFFFSRDSGVALPTAALPYNDMRINVSFRALSDVLNVSNLAATAGTSAGLGLTAQAPTDFTTLPSLSNTQIWANYAIVSNDERKRMGGAPRDILIEQAQSAPTESVASNISANTVIRQDIRFSHAVKVIFFGVRNTTVTSWRSNYTAASPIFSGGDVGDWTESPTGAVDPIQNTQLIYENTRRLDMGVDYYCLVAPYFSAPVIPCKTGLHMYSYSLDFFNVDPMGSTNYGKLTNVSVAHTVSAGAVAGSAGGGAVDSGHLSTQTYEQLVTVVNNNIIRVSGGALGFPVL
jgi:hypothetical protein